MLLAALAAAVVAQGGYYRQGQILIGGLLTLAGVAAARPLRPHVGRTLVLLGGLCASSLISAAVAGRLLEAIGPLLLLAAIAVVLLVVSSSNAAQRSELVGAVLGLGSLLGLSGWVGVAFRVAPLAHVDGNLWRAATSLTYTNAAAAILAMLVLVALARLTTSPSFPNRVGVVVLAVGLFATVSRGGLICAAIGSLVLLVALGPGLLLRRTFLPLLGAAVGAVALATSMPAASSSRPLLALGGMVIGSLVGTAPVSLSPKSLAAVGSTTVALGVVAALRYLPNLSAAWANRTSLSSPDRFALAGAALSIFARHPLTGTGPGEATYFFKTSGHHLFADRYAHNEYLQLAAEQGALGLAALCSSVVSLTVLVRRSGATARSTAGGWALWSGGCAALLCFGLESGFDFLWHVPSVDLVAALVLALIGDSDSVSYGQASAFFYDSHYGDVQDTANGNVRLVSSK